MERSIDIRNILEGEAGRAKTASMAAALAAAIDNFGQPAAVRPAANPSAAGNDGMPSADDLPFLLRPENEDLLWELFDRTVIPRPTRLERLLASFTKFRIFVRQHVWKRRAGASGNKK